MEKNSNIYELDGRVPLLQAIPFGLQHVLAMFVANITPIIILANVVGIDSAVFYISLCIPCHCHLAGYGCSHGGCYPWWYY